MARENPGLVSVFTAELIGTFLLVFFGCGAVHIAVLTGDLAGLWQVGIVWGISIMLAIYVIGAVSGAHINPAITVALASFGMFPLARVPVYIASQLAGAFLAAALLFLLFGPWLAAKEAEKGVIRGEPGSEITAMCYCEYFPNPGRFAGGTEPYNLSAHTKFNETVTMPIACLAELIGTAVLALVVVALTDERNLGGPKNLAPVFIGLTVTALICVIAPLTQACFNPARDFGPRLFAFLAGWGNIALPGPGGIGWLTVYILSPLAGGVLGVGLFRWLIRPSMFAEGSS